MSLTTRSVFYTTAEITSSNQNLNFTEGAGPELTAVLAVGTFSLSDFIIKIKTALDAAGALTYTVTVDRDTRFITITTTSTFALLVLSGSQVGTGPFSLMGFNGADRTGASTYTGDSGAVTEYLPQFILQDHVAKENEQEAVHETINETGTGVIEVVKFGNKQFIEVNARYITDIPQGSGHPIETNLTGVADAQAFMRNIVKKGPFEIIPDRAVRATFDKVLLESTPDNRNGTGFKLRELYAQNMPGYFETGVLRLRVLEG